MTEVDREEPVADADYRRSHLARGDRYEIELLQGDVATPERLLLTDEIRDTIAQAVAALPDELREAIVLREVDGLSYEDIAQAMDCPIGTVRSRIFRAREAIDKHVAPLL